MSCRKSTERVLISIDTYNIDIKNKYPQVKSSTKQDLNNEYQLKTILEIKRASENKIRFFAIK
jgi:hypothetical protein